MAVFSWYLFIITYLATEVVHIKGAGFNLACFNYYPLLKPDDDTTDNAFIGGYKGGQDYEEINVVFSRSVDTGTGSALPTGHSEKEANNGRSWRLYMPLEGGIERIGAFTCGGEQNGEFYNITAIITHSNGDPWSQQVTMSASLGDHVTLEVTRDDTSKGIQWSKDGKYVSDFDDRTILVFESVTLAHAGIYDCYYDGDRGQSTQAIIRLLVRECSARQWGPGCSNDCPFCYNGGVCDDKTGDCICAPGFGGTYCDQLFGRNTFGQEGDHHCSGSSPNSSPGCQGRQICGLDPYGCSCAAGYEGRDCASECTQGTYGADCKQTCHCRNGPAECDYATGTCKSGTCSTNWIGDNCQLCRTGIHDVSVFSINSTSIIVSWTSPVNDATFVVEYKLINTDQCQPENTNPIILPLQSDMSVTISGLSPYSTYEINVISDTWPPCLVNDAMETFITDEEAPSQKPQNVRVIIQQENSLTFQWDSIQCGNRGGDNMYDYSINSSPPRSGRVSETLLTVENLDACTEYVFKIKATNEAGAGPETSIDVATKYRVPVSVDNLTVTKITDRANELNVTWNPVECANTYTVLYRRIRIDQCLNTTELFTSYWDGDDTSVTIVGLEAYTTYQVVVYSNNSLGYGESIGIGVTDTVAPSGSPANVKLNSRTNTSLTFEWSRVPCGERGGPNTFTYSLFDMNGIVVESDTVPGLSATVYGLESCTNYSIVLNAVNDKGEGNPATPVFGETNEGVLGPVPNLKTESVTSTEWDLSWIPQNSSACETKEYLVEYTLINRDQCQVITEPEREEFDTVTDPKIEIFGLHPNSDYIVYVTPLNGHGPGMETSESGTTLESEPSGPPENLHVSDVDKYHIAYSWEQPECGNRNGVVTKYVYSSTSGDVGSTNDTSVLTSSLTPCTEYVFSVSAVVNNEGGPGDVVYETTKAEVPNQPSNLQQQEKLLTQMTVSWEAPFPMYCVIKNYTVTRRTINKPYDEDFEPAPNPEDESVVEGTSSQHTIVDLEPSTEYEIQVWAFTEAGLGDLINGSFYTAAANTPEYLGDPVTEFKIVDSTATTKTVLIPQVGDPTQYVTEYRILVEGPSVNTYSTPYIAGVVDVKELESKSVEFIVGEGSEDTSNPPLKKDTRYSIYIETCSVISESEAGCVASDGKAHGGVKPFPWWAYMLIILAVCIVVVPAVGFTIFKRAKRNQTGNDNMAFGRSYDLNPYGYGSQEEDTKSETSDTKAAVPSKKSQRAPPTPVQVTNLSTFAHYVAVKQSRNGQDTSFEEDYERLPQGALHSYDVFKLDENREKNRYKNIATYDHSRVKLSTPEGDPPTDYINASSIDGYRHPQQYIATQGPNTKSTSAFWRMVWETGCSKIVMLTNVVENGKVKSAKYWPDTSATYGNFTITLTSEDTHAHYTVRNFAITDVSLGGFEAREVCQFHYTTWPDMGVPDNAAALVDFVYVVSDHQPADGNPTVVHCSAGVGRSGTFITIESMMRQGKEKGQIDVFKFVSDMRHNRMHMIQTEDQYEFIFEALLVHFIYGDTAIPVDSFRDEYTKLKSLNHKTNVTGLAVQFQNLEDISIMPTRVQCSAASSKENVHKNRFEDMLAADQTRPFLMSEGEPGDKKATNYINATFLNGYRTRDAFLTTQMPMPNTVCDFWRMVYDYNCHTIVMLNPLDLHDQTSKQYWPTKGNLSIFGPFNVECVSKKKVDEEITSRILKLKKTKSEEGSERTIVHFSVKNWSNDGKAAPSKRTIGTLAMTVSDRIKEKKDGRVCVHCIDGMGISGTFVGITAAIQQLNQEKTVDIFQTVKRLRMCNPRVVPTKTQYRFIYEVIQDSLLSGHVYENYVTP